jgi:hypothetical protein
MNVNNFFKLFKSTIFVLITTIFALIILSLFGVQELIIRIIYTIIIIPTTLYFIIKLIKYISYSLDKSNNNDKYITLTYLLDIIISYLFLQGLWLTLTWVWGQDIFFTIIGNWNEMTPIESWIHHLYQSVYYTTGGSIPSVHLSKIIYSYIITMIAGLFSFSIWILIVQFTLDVVFINLRSYNNNNNKNNNINSNINNNNNKKEDEYIKVNNFNQINTLKMI